MSNTTPKPPTHTIFQVNGDNDKARWTRVGAAWANKDAKGFNIVFDAYPANGRTVMRVVGEREEAGEQ